MTFYLGRRILAVEKGYLVKLKSSLAFVRSQHDKISSIWLCYCEKVDTGPWEAVHRRDGPSERIFSVKRTSELRPQILQQGDR